MDRKKPSLTSPWKVGFLVALMLVVTALAVSYFITGTFAVKWNWIQLGGPSPTTWIFNFGAFVEEMAPLLLVTSLLAFCAHVLVAGAVKRYKAYVDSGVEYKNLLKSIKNVENLEDEDVMDQLRQHPELREFMLGVKHRVAALERQHAEQDKKQSSAPARESRTALTAESSTLASAIVNGPAGFGQDLGLTTPELKQIERAVRSAFAKAPEPLAVTPAASSGDLDALRASLRDTVDALRRDMIACGAGAREVEESLALLRTELQENVKPGAPVNAPATHKRVDAIADALASLGEETKRLAIGSALQASGGPDGDTIKVADELRTLATRFNTVTQYWRETAPDLKQALDASVPDPTGAIVMATAATAMSKASLWGERTVAMNEHMRALERAVGVGSAQDTTQASRPTVSVDDDLEITPRTPVSPVTFEEPVMVDDVDDDLVNTSAPDVFSAEVAEDASFADIPGFEKERKFFANAARPAAEPDDRFVVDPKEGQRWDLADSEDALSTSESPATAEKQHETDGFLTGPRPTVSPSRVDRSASPAVPHTPAQKASPSSTATLDPDADAVDLYALGAIDAVV